MKNERVLKVTEKYNEKWMFLMKFRKEWNTHCQRIKMNNITKKEENLEVNEIKEKNGKITKNTRAVTLFDDQKIKLKSAHNHKINETLNASWIFSKSQEHWFFLEKWSQKKKEMNQMHKINEIL